ncbi:MAG: sodium:alanine symporter family protein [Candidatus Omnitrophica bacterium]|nr:sodium:alanine symporter family protein [Candidatus Omnitrophota bacterium]
MVELILKINSILNGLLWGPVLILAILGVGIYLTFGNRFVQIVRLPFVFRETLVRKKRGLQGDITPFQALNVALAGTVGVGNIAGVAAAIALGGPGAIFWMWVSGILGMATKFSEVVLCIRYRIRQIRGAEKSVRGQIQYPMLGGPMVYIRRGMGKRCRYLASAFAVFGALAAFGIGNMTQANSVAIGLERFGISRVITGILLIFAVGLVTIGGIKRIAQVASIFVPFMCILYFVSALIIIILNISLLPKILFLILKSAFTPVAAVGGFAGVTASQALRWGIARGIFSNEAGLGSAPIAHATAKTDHPVRQGMWGIFEVFIDTIVICSATGLAILVTGVWTSGQTGAVLTMSAFSRVFGNNLGSALVVFSMVLTAYDTMLAWEFYGETCSAYLFGPKIRDYYRILWLPPIIIGSLGKLETIWSLADTLNGLMAIPNLFALLMLSPIVFRLTKEFFGRPK